MPGLDRHRTIYTVQGVVGYELDLWGRYQRASESARAQLLNTEFGREATKLSLTGEVARGYFGLIAAAEQLARGRDTLATREESLQLEKLRFDAGESDEFTFKRAEADAAATRVSTRQLELEVVERTNALGVLLGRSPQDLVDRAIAVQGVTLPDADDAARGVAFDRCWSGGPTSALPRRRWNASAADIGVARAQLFPSISLTGAFGSISPELGDLFTDPAEAWSAAGGLLQPLFQGGRLRANVCARRSRARAAQGGVRAHGADRVPRSARCVAGTVADRGRARRERRAGRGAVAGDGAGRAALRAGRHRVPRVARRAARPVPGADRPGRRAARCVAEHGRPRAGGRRRTRRQAEPLSASR